MDENSIDAVAEAYGWLWHVVSEDKRLHKVVQAAFAYA